VSPDAPKIETPAAAAPEKEPEPSCHNDDWDQARETFIEFAARMVVEKGWKIGSYIVYERPGDPPIPNLWVDYDSILWIECTRIQIVPWKMLIHELLYVSTPQNHLDFIDDLIAAGHVAQSDQLEAAKLFFRKHLKGA